MTLLFYRKTFAQVLKSCFSGDTARFCATLHAGVPSAPFPLAFWIERTRNSLGAYTSDGVGLGACVTGISDSGLSSSLYQYQYYPLDGSPLPPMEKKWGFLAPEALATSIKGNKAYTWPLTSLYPAMVNPFTCFQAYMKPDFGVGEPLNVTVYGSPVPYMPIGGFAGFVDTRNTNLTFMQRYD